MELKCYILNKEANTKQLSSSLIYQFCKFIQRNLKIGLKCIVLYLIISDIFFIST